MKSTEISRVNLYKEVWSTPMLQLAKKYKMSDRGLAKLCARHNIPRPPRGYWAKLSNNVKTKKVKLPNPSQNNKISISPTPEKVTVNDKSETQTTVAISGTPTQEPIRETYGFKTDEAITLYDQFRSKASRLPSDDKSKVKKLHPFVLEVKRKFDDDLKNNKRRYGRGSYGGISLYEKDLSRAYKILNILIRDFEYLGFTFKDNCEYWQTISYEGNEFSFQLGTISGDKYKLSFKTISGGAQDGTRTKLEKRLKYCVFTPLYELASRLDQKLYKQQQEEETKWRTEQQEKAYAEIKPEVDALADHLSSLKKSLSEEQEFNKQLNTQFDDWQKSQQIRLSIEAKQAASHDENIDAWLLRANALANYVDPFSDVTLKRTDKLERDIQKLSDEIDKIKMNFPLLELGVKKPKYNW